MWLSQFVVWDSASTIFKPVIVQRCSLLLSDFRGITVYVSSKVKLLEYCRVLECNIMWCDRLVSTFRCNLLPPSAVSWWRHLKPSKRWYLFRNLQAVAYENIMILILTSVRTSNLTWGNFVGEFWAFFKPFSCAQALCLFVYKCCYIRRYLA
jgi:hypothetical protein